MDLFTNGVGRPSNETIKKRNIFKGICALLVLVIVGLVVYILNDKGIITINNKKNNSKKDIVTTKKELKEEKLSEAEAIKLFSKYNLYTNWLSLYRSEEFDRSDKRIVDNFSYFYDNNVTKNSISDEIKFAISLGNLYKKTQEDKNTSNEDLFYEQDMQTSKKIKFDDINSECIKLFGSKINIEKLIDKNNIIDIAVMGNEFKYNKDNTIESIGGGIGDGASMGYYTKIIDIKEEAGKLEITNKVFFESVLPDGDMYYITTKSTDINNITGIVAKLKSKIESDEIFNEYNDKLYTYKWTFVKVDNNYIFESVEKIN